MKETLFNISKIKVIFLFLIFSLLSINTFSAEDLTIKSPNYFGEQGNTLDDIHYLKDEMLSFEFCGDALSSNITVKYICPASTEEIDLFQNWEK